MSIKDVIDAEDEAWAQLQASLEAFQLKLAKQIIEEAERLRATQPERPDDG